MINPLHFIVYLPLLVTFARSCVFLLLIAVFWLKEISLTSVIRRQFSDDKLLAFACPENNFQF